MDKVMDGPGLARRPLDGALDTIAVQRAQMDKAVKALIKVKMITPAVSKPVDDVIDLLVQRPREVVLKSEHADR